MLKTNRHANVNLSSVGIGTWAIGGPYWTDGDPTGWSGPLDDDDSVRALEHAIENGLFHVDTADVYGLGRSERLVGKALRGNSRDYTVATKVGFVATSAPSSYSPENIRFQFEQSMRNMGTERASIYYLHHCDFGEGDRFLDDAIGEIQRLKEEGRIGSIGLSGYSASDLIRVSTRLKPDFIQSWASIEHPEFIRDDGQLAKHMKANGIKFIAMMPFGQGRLLGKYNPATPPEFGPGDTRLDNGEFRGPSLAEVEPKIVKLRERFGPDPKDLIGPALGFVLSHDVVVSVIPGFRNSAQVKQICEAAQFDFSASDREFIESVFPFSESQPHPWQE